MYETLFKKNTCMKIMIIWVIKFSFDNTHFLEYQIQLKNSKRYSIQ